MYENGQEPVTRSEFKDFISNHHATLQKTVEKLSNTVEYLRGRQEVMLGLTVALLGGIIALIVLVVVQP